MSQPAADVIDLTEEPSSPGEPISGSNTGAPPLRAPRARRNFVDLEDEDELPNFQIQSRRSRGNRERSPEVEFVYSRPRSRPPATTTRPRSHSVTSSTADGERARNYGDSIGSMMRAMTGGLRRNLLPFPNLMNRPFGGGHHHDQHPPHHHHHHHHHEHHDHHHHHHRHDRHSHQVPNNADLLFLDDANLDHLVLPTHLDFETQGFPMGRNPRPSVPPPTYEPPASPRKGFTRTPKEEEILICPNCNEELGVGEDEVKRQVWVVKSCGHVYS